MIPSPGLVVLAAVCAFVMGFALNQGSTCAVVAARQVLDERRPTRLLRFGVAAATAGRRIRHVRTRAAFSVPPGPPPVS